MNSYPEVILNNSKDPLHTLEHVNTMLDHLKAYSDIDKELLTDVIVWQDVGKAKYGQNIVTILFDGAISAVLFLKMHKLTRRNLAIAGIIRRHTRLGWWLGPTIDKILCRPKSIEEKIFLDLDLLELVNPKRLQLLTGTKRYDCALKYAGLVSPDFFYTHYAKEKLVEYQKRLDELIYAVNNVQ